MQIYRHLGPRDEEGRCRRLGPKGHPYRGSTQVFKGENYPPEASDHGQRLGEDQSKTWAETRKQCSSDRPRLAQLHSSVHLAQQLWRRWKIPSIGSTDVNIGISHRCSSTEGVAARTPGEIHPSDRPTPTSDQPMRVIGGVLVAVGA